MTRAKGAGRLWSMTTVEIVACLLLAFALAVGRAATRFYLREGHVRAEAALNLTASALSGWIRRLENVPQLLTDDEALRRLVLEPDAIDVQHRVAEANRWLEERNAILGSSEISVIGLDGTTIAASNFAEPDSFIGQNFAYRPYFTQAKAGRGLGGSSVLGPHPA